MKKIEIYTTPICGYCMRAKMLLERKGLEFEEIDLFQESHRREEMMTRSGRFTVPQIFIDDAAIGGCDELYALESRGALDELLGGELRKL